MTASWRGLAILTALALALALAVVLDAPPRGTVADRRLAPGVTALATPAASGARRPPAGGPVTAGRPSAS